MSLTVRYAESSELGAVNRLREYVNAIHIKGRPDIFRPGFGAELANHLYDKAASDSSDVIVALKDDAVCGYAIVEYISKPQTAYNLARSFCHIEELGVDEACERQGVGTAIMAFCRNEAMKKGFSKIELDVWEFNSSALDFYNTLGFKTVRRYMEAEL